MSKTFVNLLAITVDINWYKTHSKEIGCQFFKYWQGLSPLGIQLIIDCRHVVDNFPLL